MLLADVATKIVREMLEELDEARVEVRSSVAEVLFGAAEPDITMLPKEEGADVTNVDVEVDVLLGNGVDMLI